MENWSLYKKIKMKKKRKRWLQIKSDYSKTLKKSAQNKKEDFKMKKILNNHKKRLRKRERKAKRNLKK
jgi:hypothetical protein